MGDIGKVSEAFVFEKGCLVIKTKGHPDNQLGNGHIAIREKELQWDQDDETGQMSAWISVHKDDLKQLRDFLIRVLGEL